LGTFADFESVKWVCPLDGLELPGTKLMVFVLSGAQAGAATDGLA
jgi:hypothetical protein